MEKLLEKKWFAMLAAFFCTLLWGSAYPVIKLSYQQLNIQSVGDQLLFAGVRFLLAGMMVLLVTLVKNKGVFSLQKKHLFSLSLYGVVQTGLMYLFNYIGVANTTATKTSLLTAMAAFLAVLLAPLFFKDDRLSVNKILGVVLGFFGVLLVNTGLFGGSFSFFGEGFVLIGAILNTAGGFISKKVAKGIVFEATAIQLSVGGVFLLLAGLLFHGALTFSWGLILSVSYLAFVSAAAFSIWTALLVRHEAGNILIFNLFIPITGALWSLLILGETQILDPLYLLSVLLITAGIVLVNLHRKSGNISTNKSI